MTIHTGPTSVPHGTADVPPAVRRRPDTNSSVRMASLIAGTVILLIAALSVGAFAVPVGLAVHADAAGTAGAIVDSQGTFRLGIASMLLIPTLDIVAAWATYRILRPVNEGVSMLAAWLRVASAGVYMVAISELLGILHLLSGNDPTVFTAAQSEARVLAAVNAFNDIWAGSLILFGLHLLLI